MKTLCLLLLTLAFPASQLQAQPRVGSATLTASGHATISTRPDQALVRLGVVAEAREASLAQQQVNKIIERVINDLRELGLPQEAIQTAHASIHPVHSYPTPVQGGPPPEPRIVGFRASNTLQVKVDDLTLIGRVIDAGIRAGANQLEGLNFQLRDDLPARQRALAAATRQAQAKALTLAETLDLQLGGLAEIIEGADRGIRPPPHPGLPRMRAAMLEAHTATPIEPGEVQVEAEVTLIYWLRAPRQP
jgi:uncharacterized protein